MIGEVRSWASILDQPTKKQAERIARAPGLAGHVALMADAHMGIGATVGSVIPTRADTIIPAAVGVDIGCGMMACRTDLPGLPEDADLQALVHQFSRSIPAGLGRGHDKSTEGASEWLEQHPMPACAEEVFGALNGGIRRAQKAAAGQLGSLGSGNHFAEVCVDRDGGVWALLHSGSRGVGNMIAQLSIDRARAECWEELEDPDTARLAGESFEQYVEMMTWAQAYAYANRDLIMRAMLDDMARSLGDFEVAQTIQCHHNFSTLETHFGQEMWITRKGAIRAGEGEYGVVPGSMGAATHIVVGLGNPDSYESSAHGAGRIMGRSQAMRELSVESLQEAMEGTAWQERDAAHLLDEHPRAYKPIDQVMADQADLTRSVQVLRQVANYKGVDKRSRRRRRR